MVKTLMTVIVSLLLISASWADWNPGDGYKMHFPQLPDEAGWNVRADLPLILADDWQCTETGPVDEIHFWGSWKEGVEGVVESFTISVYTDIPDPDPQDPTTHSMPGDILWQRIVPIDQILIRHIIPDPPIAEGWYDPSTGVDIHPDHYEYFQYNVIDIPEPFMQEQGTIYWLAISANIPTDALELWGWKSSTENWNDDAVYAMPAAECAMPDNGMGTINLPALCPFDSDIEVFEIIDGLPPGTTMELDGPIHVFNNITTAPGGNLGGEVVNFDCQFDYTLTGTGSLTGYTRSMQIMLSAEMHTGPRTLGDPIQDFPAEFTSINGSVVGDPDFDYLELIIGSDFGLPSPGNITLTKLPSGDFAVESFFDVTYRIDFVGAPGSPLDGYSGSTVGTITLDQGSAPTFNWIEMYDPATLADTITNPFAIAIDPTGVFLGGGGGGAYGDGWYFYPDEDWWNIWFYDHPFSYERYKAGNIQFDVFPIDAQEPMYIDVAVNWSTDQWSLDQPPLDSAPPLPGVPEALYIGRQILFSSSQFGGHYSFDYIIEQYNPEWVSIDVRGYNFDIPFGEIMHSCISNEPPSSMDLSFVINAAGEECDCIPGDANGNLAINILDITYLIAYLYSGGPAPSPYALCSGDANCDCTVNILDITYLIAYLYSQGPPPCTCEQWLINCGPPLRK